jgi:hypothetical protein
VRWTTWHGGQHLPGATSWAPYIASLPAETIGFASSAEASSGGGARLLQDAGAEEELGRYTSLVVRPGIKGEFNERTMAMSLQNTHTSCETLTQNKLGHVYCPSPHGAPFSSRNEGSARA